MVYNITKYNGEPLASVANSAIDTTSTSIALLGRNSVNFGLPLNENLIALLQHFASSNPPPMPLQGQVWFDTVTSSLKVYDGLKWLVLSPPFNGNAGTATVSITPTSDVMLTLGTGQIVGAISHERLSPAQLPDEITLVGQTYDFKIRFPNGIFPGMTLATDPNGYRFNGTSSSANVLATARSISLGGSVTGEAMFDGSTNITISSSLINVLNTSINTSSYWSKVQVSSNGLVTNANVIVDQDVYAAIGYVPPSDIILTGDLGGNAVANGTVYSVNAVLNSTNVVPGTYNNVTVDQSGRVIAANNSAPSVPVEGIIMWADPVAIPFDYAWCNGQTVVTPGNTIYTPNLVPYQVGGTIYVMRVS